MTNFSSDYTVNLKDNRLKGNEKRNESDLIIPEGIQQHSHAPRRVNSQISAKNHEIIYSERLPFLTQIPIDKKNKLKLLSWKLPDIGKLNSIDLISTTKKNHDIIADELEILVKKNLPDVILLQELDQQSGKGENGKDFFEKIQKKLSKHYHVVFNQNGTVADANKTVTFYRKNSFSACAKRCNEGEHVVFGNRGYDLLTYKTGQTIGIKNVNARPSRAPLEHENAIKTELETKGKQKKAVFILSGFINCPSSKLSHADTKTNLSQGSKGKPGLRLKYEQIKFNGEDAFYTDPDSQVYRQCKIERINPKTKLSFTSKELAKFIGKMTRTQHEIARHLAPTMRIIDSYEKMVKIGNNTLLSLIDTETLFSSKGIQLDFRYASNFYDSYGIAVLGLSELVYNELKKLFPTFQYEEVREITGKMTRIVYATEALSPKLIKALYAIPLLQQLPAMRETNSIFEKSLAHLIIDVSLDDGIAYEQAEIFYEKHLQFLEDIEKEYLPEIKLKPQEEIKEEEEEIKAEAEEIKAEGDEFKQEEEEFKQEEPENCNIEQEVRQIKREDEANREKKEDIPAQRHDESVEYFKLTIKRENSLGNGLKTLKALAAIELKKKLAELNRLAIAEQEKKSYPNPSYQNAYDYITAEVERYLDNELINQHKTIKYYELLTVLADAAINNQIDNKIVTKPECQFTHENLPFFHQLFPRIYVGFSRDGLNQKQVLARPGDMSPETFKKARASVPLINMLLGLSKKSELVETISHLITTVSQDKNVTEQEAIAVYDHFLEPLKAVKEKRLIDQKKIAISGNTLDRMLHHSSSIQITTKTALWAALGAISGFVVGFVLGSILTMGMGGLVTGLGVALFAGDVALASGSLSAWRAYKKTVRNKELSDNYRDAYNKAAAAIKVLPNFNPKLFKPVKQIENIKPILKQPAPLSMEI